MRERVADYAALSHTALCQGSHTPTFKTERYVKSAPAHTGLLHQMLCPCLGCSRFLKGQAAKKFGRTGLVIAGKREGEGRVGGGVWGDMIPLTALDFEFCARQAHASIPQLKKTSH